MHDSAGILDFLYVRWTKNLNLVDSLVMETLVSDSVFRYLKVFRLHAILHGAVGAVRTQSGKRPGYCYMIERGPYSCLLGHVAGLLLCFYLKLFLPPIFKSVDFWSSMCWIVLDIELAHKNVIKESDVFLKAKFRDTHFVLEKSTNPQNKRFVHGNLHWIVWNSGRALQWAFKHSF